MADHPPQNLAAFFKQKKTRPRAEESAAPQMGLLFAAQGDGIETDEEVVETPASPQRIVWSVRELVARLRLHIERQYADTWVEGEISNLRLAPSGHLYFTLKDGEAQLPVVMFRRQVILLPFKPQEGMAVLVRGDVSVYESRGQLQVIAESLEPRGEGALRLAFEQLKEKLRSEGLFDAARKRALPEYPQTIGIITSTGGAVLRDIYNITRRRHRCMNLLVYPALMQGAGCAEEVRAGLAYFNSANAPRVDVIVIARGGGSAEDLWGFNDEALARAIAASGLPVVSAVGHETDFTIADFVADLRAPTPSAAAEILTEAYARGEERLLVLQARLQRGVRYQLLHLRQRLARTEAQAVLGRVRDGVQRKQQHMDALSYRLHTAVQHTLRDAKTALLHAESRLAQRNVMHALHAANLRMERAQVRLRALDPKRVLERGYALVFDAEGRLVRDARSLQQGDEIVMQFAQGRARATVTEKEEA